MEEQQKKFAAMMEMGSSSSSSDDDDEEKDGSSDEDEEMLDKTLDAKLDDKDDAMKGSPVAPSSPQVGLPISSSSSSDSISILL